MIALDTNLLVRMLIEDDPPQLRRVEALLARCREEGTLCWISTVVLCELEWVLAFSYRVRRAHIAQAIERLRNDPLFVLEASEIVGSALSLYRAGKGDFSDYLLGLVARRHEAVTTYTFDKALRGSDLFTVLRG